MFETQESRPWYQTLPGLIVASVLLPPVGIVLLMDATRQSYWSPRSSAPSLLLILGAGYVFLCSPPGVAQLRMKLTTTSSNNIVPSSKQQPQRSSPPPQQAQASPGQAAATASPGAETAFAHATKNYWTNYRGPNRDGRYEELPVIATWPAGGLTPIWKQPIGIGYASFTVAEGSAYTIEQRRRQEVVTAYDLNTGRELWMQGWNAEYSDSTGDGPRSTPTWDDGRLYALGATGELRCLDAKTGSVIWGKNILSENGASNLPWAMAASPLIVDDKVIVLPGGSGGKSVVAYNKMTGAPVWKSLDDRQAYVSPMLVTLNGRRQILVVSSTRAVGLAPENGSLLWSYTWDTDMGINASQPIMVSGESFLYFVGLRQRRRVGGSEWQREQFQRAHDLGKHQHEEQVQQLSSSSGSCLRPGRRNSELRRREYGRAQMERRALRLRSTGFRRR